MLRKVAMVLALLVAGGAGVAQGCNPPDDPNPVGASGEWDLNWRDEFTGATVDSSRWNLNWFGGTNRFSNPTNTREDACYDRTLASASDGLLHLGTATNADATCRRRDGSTAPYRAGHINSNGKFSTTYGYFEARVRFPGNGTVLFNWPAWWTNGQNWPEDCEFDIAEVLSNHQPSWHIHHSGGTEDGHPSGFNGNGWHTYGLEWTPTSQTFYYDGVNVGSESVDCDAPHYMILANQINQDYGVTVPTSMDVDYVRVWKRPA